LDGFWLLNILISHWVKIKPFQVNLATCAQLIKKTVHQNIDHYLQKKCSSSFWYQPPNPSPISTATKIAPHPKPAE